MCRLVKLLLLFLSQQQAELRQSGLIQKLVSLAAVQIRSFGAVEITLLLDSLARLKFSPGESMLAFVADMAAKRAPSMTAQQVTLVPSYLCFSVVCKDRASSVSC